VLSNVGYEIVGRSTQEDAMRHLRHIALVAAGLALCVPSTANALGGQLVAPSTTIDGLTGGGAMGQAWYRAYTLPTAKNPLAGNSAPCVHVGRTGNILIGLAFQPVPCTITPDTTVLVWGISNTCSTIEPPPFFAQGAAAQRRCAKDFLAPIVGSIRLSIDGGRPVDMKRPALEVFSPMLAFRLPTDNPFDVPPGPGSFTGWGWMAWLTHLPPGRHSVQTRTEFTDGRDPDVISLVIDVAP
jgi:hypothetical protein